MRKIDTTDNFVPSGCPADGKGSPAVTRWLEVVATNIRPGYFWGYFFSEA